MTAAPRRLGSAAAAAVHRRIANRDPDLMRRLSAGLATRLGGSSTAAERALRVLVGHIANRLLDGYARATRNAMSAVEASVEALLTDLDARRTGKPLAAGRTLDMQAADMRRLLDGLRRVPTLESFVRDALAVPDARQLSERFVSPAEVEQLMAELDVARPQVRTTPSGAALVRVDRDVAKALQEGRKFTADPAPPGTVVRRRRRTATQIREERAAAGRLRYTRGPKDPRLRRIDAEHLVPRDEDVQRHHTEGRSPAEAYRMAQYDAAHRLEALWQRRLADVPELAGHWVDAVAAVMLTEGEKRGLGRAVTITELGEAGMLQLYEDVRPEFWRRVAADSNGARASLASLGVYFSAGDDAAPLIGVLPGIELPPEERRLSIDHQKEKALSGNWRSAVDPSELKLIPQAANSDREIEQKKHGMR